MPYLDYNGNGMPFVTPTSYDTKTSRRGGTGASNWFQALAEAWGDVLNRKAGELTLASDQIGNGGLNQPSQVLKATALAQEFALLSSQAATAVNQTASGLERVASNK